MTPQEEQLWNYIDGNCTPVEKLEIEAKLAAVYLSKSSPLSKTICLVVALKIENERVPTQ